jgi:putative PIN family toxin of toxin-antitoxin system
VKVIVDTNVFVSGVFFSGAPYTILDAWHHKQITLVVSPQIVDEYRRVTHELAEQFSGVDPAPPLELLTVHAQVIEAPGLPEQVCTDPDDDKFLACAVASHTKIITSGDKALLKTSGYAGIEVLTPRAFVDKYLPPAPVKS